MEARSLLRSLIREGRKFPDYNIAAYVVRRAVEGFRAGKALRGQEAAKALAFAREQLDVVRRQSVVRSLYTDKMPSVMRVASSAPGAGAGAPVGGKGA